MEKNNFKIIILNQQKKKKYLNQLISVIKKESKKNQVEVRKKISFDEIKKKRYNLLISFHNSQILKKNLITFLNGNCINFHSSLLPENRGLVPIIWTAINNNNFGITIHQINSGLDTGPVIARSKISIINKKKKSINFMYHKIEKESIKLFRENFKKIKLDIKKNHKITIFKKALKTETPSYQNEDDKKKIINKLPNLWSSKIDYLNKLGKNLKFVENFKIKTFDISRNKYFKQLQDTILYTLTKTKNQKKIPTILQQRVKFDLRNNLPLMIKCEKLIKKILIANKINNFMSMQFPINIRVISSGNEKKINHNYNTEVLHCDAWSGAPSDSLNGFIYIYYQNKAPSLDLYWPLDKKDKLRNYLGTYKNANIDNKNLKKVNFKKKTGSMAIWETFSPHKTNIQITKKNLWRVSLDFRIKASDPYSEIHLDKDNKFYTSKMNSDGVYWYNKKCKNLKSKIKGEIEYAKKHSKLALKNRKIYLKNFYNFK